MINTFAAQARTAVIGIVAGIALGASGVATAATLQSHSHGHHHHAVPAAFHGLPTCADDSAVNCFTPGPTDGKAWSDAHYTILVDTTRVRYICHFWVGSWDSEHFDICA